MAQSRCLVKFVDEWSIDTVYTMAQHNIYPMRWFLYLLEGRQRWGSMTCKATEWFAADNTSMEVRWMDYSFVHNTYVIMWHWTGYSNPGISTLCVCVISHSVVSDPLWPYGCDLIAHQAPLSMGFQSSHSVQFSSVAQSCPTLCDPMNRSTPGLPVHHQLPEFNQTHAHRVGDATQPCHPLSFPSPPAPNPSQHQGLFQWVNSSHEVAKVLEFQLQHQSFQWTPRTDLL